MKRYITIDDFIDTYGKLRQRGLGFITSKFSTNGLQRTRSAFNETAHQASNWWHVPAIQQRWNLMISGDTAVNFKQHLVKNHLKNQQNLHLISFGSGDCSHELELAQYECFSDVTCVDIAPNRLKTARDNVNESHKAQLHFINESIYDFRPETTYDIVFFNASLHHFKEIHELIASFIIPILNNDGLLVINEYVGADRLQFPQHQMKAINQALQFIPKKYRKRYKRNAFKNRFYGSGLLRMIIADPSECVDSSSILPAIHKHFTTIEEKSYGGNILMNALKDISYHFEELNPEKQQILNELFDLEDAYLKDHQSDFVYGVYQKMA